MGKSAYQNIAKSTYGWFRISMFITINLAIGRRYLAMDDSTTEL